MSKDRPWGNGTPTYVLDATANDSDKTFTVPAGKYWVIVSASVALVSTATVGNRQVQMAIQNATPTTIMRITFGAQAASLTRYYVFGGAMGFSAGSVIAEYSTPIPAQMIIPAGYSVRIWDASAIDAAADDMTVNLHYVEYDA